MLQLFLFFLFGSVSSTSLAIEMSYQLIDVDSEKVVDSKEPNSPMTLASVSKIYTTYFVLNNLDPNSTFETKVYISKGAKLENGMLQGDLYLHSNGDPYLTVQNLISLIYQVREYGIKTINGNFYVVHNGTLRLDRISELGLEDQADNSGVSHLNVEFNRFKIYRNEFVPIPPLEYLKLSKGKLNQPGLKYQFQSDLKNIEHWKKNTNENHSFREELPAKNTLLFGAHYFRYLAKIHGVLLPRPKEFFSELNGLEVAIHQSLPVYRLIELGLEYSNNVIAEMLLQKVFSGKGNEAGSKMLAWLIANSGLSKEKWQGVSLVNGSGLTLKNKTTADNLSLFLAKVLKKKSKKRKLISYLSSSGHSGGLKRRLTSANYIHRVMAKTGSLFYVNNLAGYLKANSGKMYAFSVFSTDSKAREILNQKNSKKVNRVRQGAKAFYSKSNQKIDTLLTKWIETY